MPKYRVGEKVYNIPDARTNAFLEKYPSAQLVVDEPEQQKAEPVQPVIPATQAAAEDTTSAKDILPDLTEPVRQDVDTTGTQPLSDKITPEILENIRKANPSLGGNLPEMTVDPGKNPREELQRLSRENSSLDYAMQGAKKDTLGVLPNGEPLVMPDMKDAQERYRRLYYGGDSGMKERIEREGQISRVQRALDKQDDLIARRAEGKKNYFQELWGTLTDAGTWDFGLGELNDAYDIKAAADNPDDPLNQLFLQTVYENNQIQGQIDDMTNAWGRFGQITAQAIPFVAEFLLTGGFSGVAEGVGSAVTKGIAKGVGKQVAKREGLRAGAKAVEKAGSNFFVKALGTTAGDVAAAGLMANTIGAGKTVADIEQRHMGTLDKDQNGDFYFKDSSGWLESIYKGEMSNIIEYYTEMLGDHAQSALAGAVFNKGVKKGAISGARRAVIDALDPTLLEEVGVKAVTNNINIAGAKGYTKAVSELMKRSAVQGYPFEVMEEEAGILLNSIFTGDNSMSDFNVFGSGEKGKRARQTQLDIWGGMLFSIGTMRAMPMAGGYVMDAADRTLNGRDAHKAREYEAIQKRVNLADGESATILGEDKWEGLKERIDNTPNDGMSELVGEITEPGSGYTQKQQDAITKYIGRLYELRGFDTMALAQAKQQVADEANGEALAEGVLSPEEFDRKTDTAYMGGYHAPEEKHNDLKNAYEYQRANVAKMLGVEEAAVDKMKPSDVLGERVFGMTDDEAQAMMDYFTAKSAFDGMLQSNVDDIDTKVAAAANLIDVHTHDSGVLVPATMKDDSKVYVKAGNIMMNDEGTAVDAARSDAEVIVMDEETGKVKMVSPHDILSLDAAIDPEEYKAQVSQQIREAEARQKSDNINGKIQLAPGTPYAIRVEDGNMVNVQILPVMDQQTGQWSLTDKDGLLRLAYEDGSPYGSLTPEQLQQKVDEANLARLAEFEMQKAGIRAGEKAAEQEAARPQYALNDDLVLRDADGNIYRGQVTAMMEDDRVEVATDKPIDGKQVSVFPREQLDRLLYLHNGQPYEQPEENVQEPAAVEKPSVQPAPVKPIERIPLDPATNEPMWEKAAVRDTYAALVDENEGDAAEAIDTAETMLANSQSELEKARRAAEKKASGKTVSEIQKAKAARKAAIKRAEESVRYWSDVVSHGKDAQRRAEVSAVASPSSADVRRKINLSKAREVVKKEGRYKARLNKLAPEYLDFEDFVKRTLLREQDKLKWSNSKDGVQKGLGSHMGLAGGREEMLSRSWLLNNEHGKYPEELADELLVSYAEETNRDTQDIDGGNPTFALSVLLDAIRENPSAKSMMDDVDARHGNTAMQLDPYQMSDEDAQMYALNDEAKANGMTLDDYLSYLDYTEQRAAELAADAEEISAIFAEQYLEEDERRNQPNEVLGGVPEGQGPQAGIPEGPQVVQGEQPTDAGDIGGEGAVAGAEAASTVAGLGGISAPSVSGAEQVSPVSGDLRTQLESFLTDADGQMKLLDAVTPEEATSLLSLASAFQTINERLGDLSAQLRSQLSSKKKAEREDAERQIAEAQQAATDAWQPAEDYYKSLLDKYGLQDVEDETFAAIQAAREQVNTTPTDAQKEAGNYKKGHVTIDGYDISIENPKGSTRSGVDASGKRWESTMASDYGYIRRTEGVDGDHIDVFLSDNPTEGNVFVVDQVDPETGEFDEHKVMYGFGSADEAREAYLANYEEGWKGLGNITEVTKDEFRKWIDSSHRKTKPFAEYKSVKPVETPSVAPKQVNIESLIGALQTTGEAKLSEHAEPVAQPAQEEAPASESDRYTIEKRFHQKQGKDIYALKFNDRVSREDFVELKKRAKDFGGYWSNFGKKGFIFDSEDDARRFGEAVLDPTGEKLEEARPVSVEDIKQMDEASVQQADETSAELDIDATKPVQYKGDGKPHTILTVVKTGEQTESGQFSKGRISTVVLNDLDNPGRMISAKPEDIAQYEVPETAPEEVNGYKAGDRVTYTDTAGTSAKTIDHFEKYGDTWFPVFAKENDGRAQIGVWANVSQYTEPVRSEQGAVEQEPAPVNPSGNKIITDEKYAELRRRMLAKLNGQMNMGFDPEIFAIGSQMAIYHIEKGARKFADYAKAMITDLSDIIRPYLKSFYKGAHEMLKGTELASEMDSDAAVDAFDVENFDKAAPSALAAAAEVVKEQEIAKQAEKAGEEIKKSRETWKKEKNLLTLSLADGTSLTVDKSDYHTFLTPEAKEFFEKKAAEEKMELAKPQLAYLVYASDNGVNIPLEDLLEIPEIKEAQRRCDERRAKGGLLNDPDPEVKKLLADGYLEKMADYLLGDKNGSAVFENGKIREVNGDEDFSGEVAKEHKAFLVIGRSAGGKSTVYANPLSNQHKARIIDSDIVKPLLHGWNNGEGADYVHKASSAIAKMAQKKAVERGENIVIPKVGTYESDKPETYFDLIEKTVLPLIKAGYTIEFYLNDISEETSLTRSSARFARKGRFISLDYLHSIADKPNQVFKDFATKTLGEYGTVREHLGQRPEGSRPGGVPESEGGHSEAEGLVEGVGGRARNSGGTDGRWAGRESVQGVRGLEGLDPETPLFVKAEWKSNEGLQKDPPILVWSSESGEPLPGTVAEQKKTEQKKKQSRKKPSDEGPTLFDMMDENDNDNEPDATQQPQDGSAPDGQLGGVPAIGNGVLGTEGPRQSDTGTAGADRAGEPGVAGGEQAVLPGGRSDGGPSGFSDRTGEGQPEPSDGGAGLRGGNDAPRRKPVRGNNEKAAQKKKVSKPARKYTRNFHYEDNASAIDNYTPAQRLKANIDAIEVLAKLATDGRPATAEEKETLSKFRGWGGIPFGHYYTTRQLRNSYNSDAQRLADAIDVLDPAEQKGLLSAISKAALTSYYTPTAIARSMNRFLSLAGYKGGSLLDPSMGSGIFEGTLPEDIQQRTMIHGVELDWLTGQIAKALYPDGNIQVTGFEDAGTAMEAFDVVESNIPFGSIKVTDPTWKHDSSPVRKAAQGRIHNYFAVKMLESTKPGGLCVIMTSNAILDTASNAIIRDYIADQAEIVGVVRLPDNTFKGAGTSAVTDVLFLRKFRDTEDRGNTRDDEKYRTQVLQPFLSTVTKDVTKKIDGTKVKVEYNGYFGAHPDFMIGNVIGGNQYKADAFGLTSDLSTDEIAAAMDKLLEKKIVGTRKGKLFNTAKTDREVHEAVRESYVGNGDYISSGNIVEQDGKFGIVSQTKSKYGDVTRTFEERPGMKGKAARIRAMFPIRTGMKKLVAEQIAGATDAELAKLRKDLKDSYDKFVKLYGRLQEKDNSFLDDDIDGYMLRSLEKWHEGKFVGLSDIFTKNTIKPVIDLSQAQDGQSAISVSLAEYGEIRPEFMERMLGENWFDLCKEFVFRVPYTDDRYETKDAYLSGDVKTKLEQARKAAAESKGFERNVKELEAVQPRDIPFNDISIHMGARWIPQEMYTQFMTDLFGIHGANWKGPKSGVIYSDVADSFIVNVVGSELGGTAGKWATKRRTAKDIFEAALSDKTMRVMTKDRDGKEFLNVAETEAANAKVAEMREAFEDWLPRDSERVKQVAQLYNDKFNRTVLRKFDGSHLQIPGLMGMELRPHQKDAVWMLINNRGGIVDHMVGAGKTLVMQSAIMEMRRMGIAKKPMIVALKSTVGQITKEFIEAYPSARILAPTEKDFEKVNRKKFLSNIALNDYDCIIVSHEQYQMLPHTEEVETQVIREQLEQLDAAIQFIYGQEDQSQLTKRQLKGLEKRKANLEAKMKALLDRKVDREFTFESLGVDYLFVDECQQFKSLPYVTSYQNVAGLGDAAGSQKAIALLNGVRYLQGLHQGDMGTTFLSGTTITNSLVEIYNLLNYLRPREMQSLGFTTFDAWAQTFAQRSGELEYGVTQELKEKNRFRRFDNVPELARLYAEIADVRNDLNLKLPKPKPRMHVVTVPASERLKEINAEVIKMVRDKNGSYFHNMGALKNATDKKSPFGLLASGISTKAAISLKLLDPAMEDDGGKIHYVCENVAEIYKKFNDQKGTQLIFCDTGVPTKDSKYDVYSDIINRLSNDYGIPREEIVDIHVADTDKKRKELFGKVREGTVRILIGGTKNMGTGVNVQPRVVAMHHIDVPWTPADREQREGRGVRQGNIVARDFNDNNVDIYFYAAEESLDLYKYQLQDTKGKMFAQFKQGTIGGTERSFDEGSGGEDGAFDPAEIVALLSGNPVILEKSKQDKLVEKLRRAKRTYESEWHQQKADFDAMTAYLNTQESFLRQNQRDIEALEYGGFKKGEDGKYPATVTVEDYGSYGTRRTFDKPKEAGEYIHKLLERKGASVRLTGFGQTATVQLGEVESVLSGVPTYEWQVSLQSRSGIPYRVALSQDDTAAGSAFRNVLQKVYTNRDVYKRKIEEAKHKLEGADPGEMAFPKQEELDAAEARKKALDAEYKALAPKDEKKGAQTEGSASGEVNLDEEGDVRTRTAYHGSGFDFDNFSLRNVGNGEGEMAHGYGHYVSFNKETGIDYAWNIAVEVADRQGLINPDVRRILDNDSFGSYDEAVTRYDELLKARQESIRKELDEARKEDAGDKKLIRGLEKDYENIMSYRPLSEVIKDMRNIYTVDIPEDTGENYIEEMKTLSKAGRKRIADVVRGLPESRLQRAKHGPNWLPQGFQTLASVIEREQYAGKEIRERLVDALGSEKAASEVMHDAGFVGMTYNGRIDGPCAVIFSDDDISVVEKERYRIREDAAPTKTGTGYKVFFLKDGLLYPPMVANRGGEATPAGIWLDADAAPIAGYSKEGRPQVAAGGKGTQGGKGKLAYRPGWHLGSIPYALQFNRGKKVDNPLGILTKKGTPVQVGEYFPKNFVWAEVEYAADVDYQKEANSYGQLKNGKFRHSYAGLPYLPTNGAYTYRTNPNPATDPWIITGAMKVNRILTPSEVDELVKAAGRAPQQRQKGAVTDEQVNALNVTLASLTRADDDAKVSAAKQLGKQLGVNVRIVTDVEKIKGSDEQETARARGSKGFFGTASNRITVVIPNNANVADVMATVFHEVVGHRSIKDVVGERPFTNFLARVWMGADENARERITEAARRNKWGFAEGVEEYIAELAENGFADRENAGFIQKVAQFFRDMLSEAKIRMGALLNERDVMYALWRGYQLQKRRGALGEAENIAMKQELGVGEFAEPNRYRSGGSPTPSTGKSTARATYEDKVRIVNKEGQKTKTANLGRRLLEAYQDSMYALKVFQQAISEETGKPIEDHENAYMAENRMSSMNKAQAEIYNRDFYSPLMDAIKALNAEGADYNDIITYIIAKHGLERNEVFSKREAEKDGGAWDGTVKDFSGLTGLTGEEKDFTAAAEAVVKAFEDEYETNDLWERINAATKETLRKSYDSGLMTRDVYNQVKGMFEYYIPLRGWSDNVAADEYDYLAGSRRLTSPTIKKAEGRKSIADDPIATIGHMAESAIMQGNRNTMKQKFLNFVVNNPTTLASVSEQWYVHDAATDTWEARNPNIPENATGDEVADLVEQFEADMKALEATGEATRKRAGLTLGKHVTAYEGQEHVVRVMRGGKEYCIYVNANPRAAQAVNGMTNPDAVQNAAVEMAKRIKNFMARMFTSQNPSFIISNLSRDVIWAATAVSVKEDSDYNKQYQKNILGSLAKVKLVSLVKKFQEGKLDESVEVEKYFKEFIENGGETGFTNINTVEDFKRDIDRMLKEAKGGVANVPKKVWRGIWDSVEFLNRAAEDATRFAVYMTSRQQGRTVARSVYDAKEITVNFNKKGNGGYLNNVMKFAYIFFNATIQSLANFGKLMSEHPAKMTAALSTFAVAGFLSPFLNAWIQAIAGDGDGDDDDWYWDLPEWVRRNNLVFHIPFTDRGYLTIPLPHELRAFFGMGEIANGVMQGKQKPAAALKDAVDGFSTMAPIDYTGNAGSAAVNLTPTIAQPFAQLIANKDFFGKPIYKRSDWNKRDPEWTKAYRGSSSFLVNGTRWLNELTGGDEVKKGWLDLNPAIIEHLFESYLGGVGKTLNRSAKTVSMLWDEDLRQWRNVPVASTFYQEGDERSNGSQLNREYFEYRDEHEDVEHMLSGYKRKIVEKHGKGDTEGEQEYREILQDFVQSPEFKRYQALHPYVEAVSKCNSALKNLEGEDRKRLESRMNELKKELVDKLHELNEQ